MRDTQRRLVDWTGQELEEYVNLNLGKQEMWNRLRFKHGVPHDVLQNVLVELTKSEELVEFMGGPEVVDSLPPQLRDRMALLSALRYFLESQEPGYGRR